MKIEIMQLTETQDEFTVSIRQVRPELPIDEALQIKAAELWLKLGEADQALRELENLPQEIWNHPHAIKTRIAAVHALRT